MEQERPGATKRVFGQKDWRDAFYPIGEKFADAPLPSPALSLISSYSSSVPIECQAADSSLWDTSSEMHTPGILPGATRTNRVTCFAFYAISYE